MVQPIIARRAGQYRDAPGARPGATECRCRRVRSGVLSGRLCAARRSTLVDPDSTPREPPAHLRARLVVAAVLVLVGLWILHDFLPALAWAVVLAIALWPLY